jgi:YidC/Oxa1 family membrane protein insertase
VSKVLFYPLTVKSMRSMKAMQALQPQVNALRSKYQKDPQSLQRETLALYKKHRVNPMGGCLPMVAQVPIFYALYLALSVSVELQARRSCAWFASSARSVDRSGRTIRSRYARAPGHHDVYAANWHSRRWRPAAAR